jgi:hypothetical protein
VIPLRIVYHILLFDYRMYCRQMLLFIKYYCLITGCMQILLFIIYCCLITGCTVCRYCCLSFTVVWLQYIHVQYAVCIYCCLSYTVVWLQDVQYADIVVYHLLLFDYSIYSMQILLFIIILLFDNRMYSMQILLFIIHYCLTTGCTICRYCCLSYTIVWYYILLFDFRMNSMQILLFIIYCCLITGCAVCRYWPHGWEDGFYNR